MHKYQRRYMKTDKKDTHIFLFLTFKAVGDLATDVSNQYFFLHFILPNFPLIIFCITIDARQNCSLSSCLFLTRNPFTILCIRDAA